MPTITFRTKVREVLTIDGRAVAYSYVQVPKLSRSHCDMQAFRTSQTYGVLANSDLFDSVLAKIRDRITHCGRIRLDTLPKGVTVDQTGFLATITIDA